MSGVASTFKKLIDRPDVQQGFAEVRAEAKPAIQKASSAAEELAAARLRARRGGRALLSDQRLMPEAGVGQQTLGSGPMA